MPREKDVMSFMATSPQRQTARRNPPQETSLWPSGRGTEIGHFEAALGPSAADLLPLVRRLNAGELTGESFFERSSSGILEIVLRGFAGERAVTLVQDPSQSTTTVAVIADQNGKHAQILQALQRLLGPEVAVIAAPPERPGPGQASGPD
jgi:hypothetical protein